MAEERETDIVRRSTLQRYKGVSIITLIPGHESEVTSCILMRPPLS